MQYVGFHVVPTLLLFVKKYILFDLLNKSPRDVKNYLTKPRDLSFKVL